MRAKGLVHLVAGVALASAVSGAAEVVANAFMIVAPDQPSVVATLSKTLCPEKPDSVQSVGTLREALDSTCDVLVLFLPRAPQSPPDAQTVAELRERRIIGVGYGAAQLFGSMGLEIKGGGCAHNPRDLAPEIQIEANTLWSQLEKRRLVAFRVSDSGKAEDRKATDYNVALYLPRKDEATQFVEAIARWPGGENYAPIVKQGNHIMVGLAAPPELWTDEYRIFFATMAHALAKQPRVPFVPAGWKITRPGTYEFELAELGSTTDLFAHHFRFRFAEPTKFSAELDLKGSAAATLMFRGDNGELATKKEGKTGDTLRIDVVVTKNDIQRIGQGYWVLELGNFDRASRATCKLKIEY